MNKPPPIDLAAMCERILLAGLTARHAPVTDEESDQGERWNAETQQQLENKNDDDV